MLCCCLLNGQDFGQYSDLFESLFSQDVFIRLSSYQKINGTNSFVIFKDDDKVSYYHKDSNEDNIHYFGEALLYRNDIQYFFVMDNIIGTEKELTFEFHSTSRMKLEKDNKEFVKIIATFKKVNESWELHFFQVKNETCCKW